MKKVLILAYDFPPLISIGAQRPYSWFKYFPFSGNSVTVVTRHWNKETQSAEDFVKPTTGEVTFEEHANAAQVIRVPFNPNLRDRLLLRFGPHRLVMLRRLLTFFYTFAEHLWLLFDSKAAIYSEAEKFIKVNKVDFIIATGEPFILFKYASILSATYNIPWIADYRDGWTTNQGNYQQGALAKLQQRFFRVREKQYLANASHITTAAPEYAAALKQIHPQKDVSVIFNGYDEEVFDPIKNLLPPTDRFVISYAGSIYPHQNIEMFLTGLELFLQQKQAGKPVEVNFYGLKTQTAAVARISKFNTAHSVINCLPRMPYAQVAEKLKQSHLLLLLSAKNANWLNAKVFDYLATGRTIILAENDHGILEKLLHEMDGGLAFTSAAEISEYLNNAYNKFNQGAFEHKTIDEKVRFYTRKSEAARYCQLLGTLK